MRHIVFLFGPLAKTNGAIAQLGERYNGIVEVSGSIPLSSTKFFNDVTQKSFSLTLIVGHLYLDKTSIRQFKLQFTLKRDDDVMPVACDLPENVREQIFEPAFMTEAIYVSSNVKKR